MQNKISIILADDHTMFREAISHHLSAHPALQVVAEAENGKELLDLARQWQPTLIFADINMPGINGIEATRQLKKEFPSMYVIALTMLDDEFTLKKMLEAGADGYLQKNAGKAELTGAIESVMRGQKYFCSQTREMMNPELTDIEPPDGDSVLTSRQKEILQCICDGMNCRQMAKKLSLSPKTIDGHRDRIRLKTGIHKTALLIMYAYKHGLVK